MTQDMHTVQIKPHHFVDIISSFCSGQNEFEPHPYGHALHSVSKLIHDNKGILLQIELGIDDICRPCQHNVDGKCEDKIDTSYRPSAPPLKREWNLLIDRRWCERLNIKQDDALTAKQFCERLAEVGDEIVEIYREVPADRTLGRLERLKKGISYYLGQNKTPEKMDYR